MHGTSGHYQSPDGRQLPTPCSSTRKEKVQRGRNGSTKWPYAGDVAGGGPLHRAAVRLGTCQEASPGPPQAASDLAVQQCDSILRLGFQLKTIVTLRNVDSRLKLLPPAKAAPHLLLLLPVLPAHPDLKMHSNPNTYGLTASKSSLIAQVAASLVYLNQNRIFKWILKGTFVLS